MPRAKPIKRLTPAQINSLAINVVSGLTYITNKEYNYRLSFGILFMFYAGDPQNFKNVGALYEDYHKALPRSINGLPQFVSCKMLNRKDLKPLLAEMERVKTILKPSVPSAG